MENDYNKRSAKIPKYEKLTQQNFQIFSGLVRKWLGNFSLGWPDMCRPSRPIFLLPRIVFCSVLSSGVETGPFNACPSHHDRNFSGRSKASSPTLLLYITFLLSGGNNLSKINKNGGWNTEIRGLCLIKCSSFKLCHIFGICNPT